MSAFLLGQGEIARTIKLPFFLSTVSAGFPSPAQDYIEQTLDLNELLVQRPAATYFVRVQGDSMIEAGIFDGDILVVDRSLQARQGDIVIASLLGELTVKQLQLEPRCCLLPRNPAYKPIEVSGEESLELFGVVTNVIHSLRS